MNLTTLTDAVEAAYASADAPSWPDPHPDRQPSDEEYSRVTDPSRYRIVGSRADAWVAALTGLGLATATAQAGGDAWRFDPGIAPGRGVSLHPTRPGALPLHLTLTDLEGVPDCVLGVGVGDPPVVALYPDCLCDACDSGSSDLLAVVDEGIARVVDGRFLRITTRKGEITDYEDGREWSTRHSDARVERMVATARAGRSRHPVVSGAAWF